MAFKIYLTLILFVAFFVVSSGLFLILHIVFKNLQEKRNKDLLGKMPNYMAICACILAQIIAIGWIVLFILETFEVGKNMPQNHHKSEFDHLNGSDSTKMSDDQFWDQFKQKPQ